MHDPSTFEARLAAALQRRADRAPDLVDAYAVARNAAAAAGARPTMLEVFLGLSGRRTARLLLTAAMLVLATAVALFIGSQLMSPAPRLGRVVATGEMTAARDGHTATRLPDGRVLLVGGGDPLSAELYDPATGTFTPTGSLGTDQRLGDAAALLHDGRVLIVGGADLEGEDLTESAQRYGDVYDPVTGRFSRTGPMVEQRNQLRSALTLPDGRVLVAGGHSPDAPGATSQAWAPTSSVELYDPATGGFVPGGSLQVPRSTNTLSMLPDGRVLVAGGWGPDGPIASAEIYDPATGTSTLTGDMSSARGYHAAVALEDGRILLVGGHGPGTDPEVLASVEIFDPARGTFQAAGRLITERSGANAVLLEDGRVLVAGGNNRDGDPRTVEVYDPGTGTTEIVGRIEPGQDNFNSFSVSTTLLEDGGVLLAGGNGTRAERFDATLASEPAKPHSSLGVPVGFVAIDGPGATRTGHTATRLVDGRVLIAGGSDGANGPTLASAEIFDPATGESSPTGSMVAARAGHAAVLLSDGRVLIASGLGNADADTSQPSMELYDPATGTFTAGEEIAVAEERSRVRQDPYEGSPAALPLPDGRILIVGWDPARTETPRRSVQVFDPATGDLKEIDLPEGMLSRGMHGAMLLADGRVLILDGNDESLQAEVYDPVADQWELAGSTSGRQAFSATAQDDLILIAGGRVGSNSFNDESLAAVETWDPVTGAFSKSGGLGSARVGHTATLLPDGSMLIAGGRDHRHREQDSMPVTIMPEAYPDPELWDPAARMSGRAGTMAVQRSGHTATLLDDGRVLIVGGATRPPDRDIPEPPYAELYVGPEGAP